MVRFFLILCFITSSLVVSSQNLTNEDINWLKKTSIILDVQFVLIDQNGKRYISSTGNVDYYSRFYYILPVSKNKIIFPLNFFQIPKRDTIYEGFKKILNIKPIIKDIHFWNWDKKEILVKKNWDTINYYKYKYIIIDKPDDLPKSNINKFNTFSLNRIRNAELLLLNSINPDSLKLYKEINIDYGNVFASGIEIQRNGIIIRHNDSNFIELYGYNKGELFFPFPKNYSISKTILRDSLNVLDDKPDKIQIDSTPTKYNVNIIDNKSSNDSIKTECLSIDTIFYNNPGEIILFKYKCKFGYKSKSYIYPAIFESAEPFFTYENELGYRKVKAYKGKTLYIIRRNLIKSRPQKGILNIIINLF